MPSRVRTAPWPLLWWRPKARSNGRAVIQNSSGSEDIPRLLGPPAGLLRPYSREPTKNFIPSHGGQEDDVFVLEEKSEDLKNPIDRCRAFCLSALLLPRCCACSCHADVLALATLLCLLLTLEERKEEERKEVGRLLYKCFGVN